MEQRRLVEKETEEQRRQDEREAVGQHWQAGKKPLNNTGISWK